MTGHPLKDALIATSATPRAKDQRGGTYGCGCDRCREFDAIDWSNEFRRELARRWSPYVDGLAEIQRRYEVSP